MNNTALQQINAEVPQVKQSSGQVVKAGFFDVQSFELLQRVANAFTRADLIPKQYQGNLSNCIIALDMAQRMGANPLMVMQNLYIVHGTPSWSSKFLIATVNTSGDFSKLRYEWKGEPGKDDYGCRAWAVEKETGERLDGIWITWKMVKAEGWHSKNGSKWNTMPDQMFVYRAAAFWQRAYAPEISMGLQTAEESEDTYDAKMNPDGSYGVSINDAFSSIQPAERVDKETGEITEAEQAAEAEQPASNETEKPEEQAQQAEPEAEKKKPAPRSRGRGNQQSMDME
jgi:hypothetical protein